MYMKFIGAHVIAGGGVEMASKESFWAEEISTLKNMK